MLPLEYQVATMVMTETVHLDKVAEVQPPITAEVAVHLGTTAATAENREPWALEEMEVKILATTSDQVVVVVVENTVVVVVVAIALQADLSAVVEVEVDPVSHLLDSHVREAMCQGLGPLRLRH